MGNAGTAGKRQFANIFVDNEWMRSGAGRAFDSIDPFTGRAWASFPDCDEADVDSAVRAAKRAFETTNWRTDGYLRSQAMSRLADLLEGDAERLGVLETQDNGKLVRETVGQAKFAARIYRYFGGLADKIDGRVVPLHSSNLFDFTVYEPFGVCALLLAWNSPLQLLANKLAPALAAGNTVVVKPSEVASASVLEFARLVQRAGFPPGVFNVVSGVGPTVGSSLAEHPDVELVSLTGGLETGRAVGAIAARGPKKVVLELGGKSPNIIFADADLSKAIPGVLTGIFSASGQTCIAGSRLLVHKSVSVQVIDELVARARSIRLGNPSDPQTEMGPLATESHMRRVLRFISDAVDEGAVVATGGKRACRPDLNNGWFVEPTILVNVKPTMKIACVEVFGPVLAVFAFSDDEEAIELANGTDFGLAAGIWTTNLNRAFKSAQAIRAGSVWVNTYRASSPAAPFGGFKRSGLGRERGREALLEYLQVKNVMIDMTPGPQE